jgi:hypothetical protein
MALTWGKFEGFEDNNFGVISPIGGTAVANSNARTGNYSLYVPHSGSAGDTTHYHGFTLRFDNQSFLYFQYGIKFASATNFHTQDDPLLILYGPGNIIMGGLYQGGSSNTLRAWVGNKITLAGETTSVISQTYMVVEIYWKVHETLGEIKIWMNGNLEIDYSGNTKVDTAEEIMAMRHFCSRYALGSPHLYIDDIAIGDDRLYGAAFHKIATLTQGHYDQWTPQGDVAALNCVTPTPPSMDKYIKTTTDGHKQSFGHTGYTPADGIGAVIARHYGQGGGQVTLGRRHNSTDYMEVAPVNLPGVFNVLDQIYFEKPGGGAWDKTTLDATEFIIEAEIPA